MRGYGAVSLIVLLFSWLALDDITTDNANEFPLEYTILVVAAVWFAVLGGTLIARRRLCAGVASLVAVAIGVAACWSLPHHYQPPSLLNYVGYLPLAWFLGLAVWLVAGRMRAAAAGTAAT
jgi:hypothetical protein